MAALLLAAAAAPALSADYRDPKNVFAISYDEGVWSLDIDESGDFGLRCAQDACKGAVTGCFVNKERVLFGTVERIMKGFDGARIAQDQIAVFAEQKAVLEKGVASGVTWDVAADVPPQLVQAYAPRRIAGHPFLQAEFRMSMAGKTARYVSFMTAGASHSIAIVCHASEESFGEWRPRFEALMASFRTPAPKGR
jgi:hypothetical protein